MIAAKTGWLGLAAGSALIGAASVWLFGADVKEPARPSDQAVSYDFQDGAIGVPPDLLWGGLAYDDWKDENAQPILQTFVIPANLLPDPTVQTSGTIHEEIWGRWTDVKLDYARGIAPENDRGELGYAVLEPMSPSDKVVLALHGHEEPHRGDIPTSMIETDHWAVDFVRRGYRVIVPSHLFYDNAAGLYERYPHHVVWTAFMEDVLSSYRDLFSSDEAAYAVGVSSGCMTASLLTSISPMVKAFSGGGCTMPLNWLREYYRIDGHPNQWDLPQFQDELPIYLLGADKKFQFQIGSEDMLFPDGQAWIRPRDGKQITQRDIYLSDIAGVYLTLDQVFRKADKGGQVDVKLHDLGHTISVDDAIDFFDEVSGREDVSGDGRS